MGATLLDRIMDGRDPDTVMVEANGRGLRPADLADVTRRLAERIDAGLAGNVVVVCGDRNDELLVACLAARLLGRDCAVADSHAPALGRLGLLAGAGRVVHGGTVLAGASRPPEVGACGFLLLTSGSTGAPRWAVRPDDSIIEEGERYRRFLDFPRGGLIAVPMPMSHAFTLGLALGLMAHGARLRLWTAFSPRQVARSLATDDAVLTALVPASARLVCSAAEAMETRCRGEGRIVVGAGPVDADLDARLMRHFGRRACRNYGSTETGAVLGSLGEEAPAGATGRAFPRVEARLESDGGDGATLRVRTATPFAGYLGAHGLERDRLAPDGWFDMGDYCRAEDGWLTVTGRRGTAVRRGGVAIDPAAIELALAHHPDVAECAVIGAPDRDGDEVIEAHVAAAPGRTPTGQHLHAFLADRLPRHLLPGRFVFHPALPRGPAGKIDRAWLRGPGGLPGRIALARRALSSARAGPKTPPDAALGLDLLDRLAAATPAAPPAADPFAAAGAAPYEAWLAEHVLGEAAVQARLAGDPATAVPPPDVMATYVRRMRAPALLAGRRLARLLPPAEVVVEAGIPAGVVCSVLGRAWPRLRAIAWDPRVAAPALPAGAGLVILHNAIRRLPPGSREAGAVARLAGPGTVVAVCDVFAAPWVDPTVLAALRVEWWAMGLSQEHQVDRAIRGLGLRRFRFMATLEKLDDLFSLALVEVCGD